VVVKQEGGGEGVRIIDMWRITKWGDVFGVVG